MSPAFQVKAEAPATVRQRRIVKTNPTGAKTESVFADGTSILLSNVLASFIRPGDELFSPVGLEAADVGTQLYIRNTNDRERRQDAFQAEVGYATQPRKDKRGNLYVSAEVIADRLGISAVHLPCEVLRDYFYVGHRLRPWDRQPSFYGLLRVNTSATPAALRLAITSLTTERSQCTPCASPHPH